MSDILPEVPRNVLAKFAEPASIFSPKELQSMSEQINTVLGFKDPGFIDKCKTGMMDLLRNVGKGLNIKVENAQAGLSLGITQTLIEDINSGNLEAPKELVDALSVLQGWGVRTLVKNGQLPKEFLEKYLQDRQSPTDSGEKGH